MEKKIKGCAPAVPPHCCGNPDPAHTQSRSGPIRSHCAALGPFALVSAATVVPVPSVGSRGSTPFAGAPLGSRGSRFGTGGVHFLCARVPVQFGPFASRWARSHSFRPSRFPASALVGPPHSLGVPSARVGPDSALFSTWIQISTGGVLKGACGQSWVEIRVLGPWEGPGSRWAPICGQGARGGGGRSRETPANRLWLKSTWSHDHADLDAWAHRRTTGGCKITTIFI
jgi:hypothetical protein